MGRGRKFKEVREVKEFREVKELKERNGRDNKFANRRLQIQRSAKMPSIDST